MTHISSIADESDELSLLTPWATAPRHPLSFHYSPLPSQSDFSDLLIRAVIRPRAAKHVEQSEHPFHPAACTLHSLSPNILCSPFPFLMLSLSLYSLVRRSPTRRVKYASEHRIPPSSCISLPPRVSSFGALLGSQSCYILPGGKERDGRRVVRCTAVFVG